jgi:hypothetical protein
MKPIANEEVQYNTIQCKYKKDGRSAVITLLLETVQQLLTYQIVIATRQRKEIVTHHCREQSVLIAGVEKQVQSSEVK